MSKTSILITCSLLLTLHYAKSGNPERVGQAGASQLLINPYTRNMGMVGSNSAKAMGLEAQFLNVAGTAFTRNTEVLFNRTAWLMGTDININTFGITQGLSETSSIGFGVVAIDAGKIDITTEEMPEGGLGYYNPSFYNISLSYAKMFSDNIYGGINMKVINEQIPNAAAKGVALDAGIQYHTGKYNNIHVGIALKNWGPKMSYRGDGLTRQTSVNAFTGNYEMTVNNRSGAFELPTMVNIGASYDLYLHRDSSEAHKHNRLTFNGTFTSNSFTYDNGLLGLEYAWHEMLMLRGGYYYEEGIGSVDTRRTAFTGPAVGITIEVPFNEKHSTFGLDYSYRTTNPFSGIHSFGFRINL